MLSVRSRSSSDSTDSLGPADGFARSCSSPTIKLTGVHLSHVGLENLPFLAPRLIDGDLAGAGWRALSKMEIVLCLKRYLARAVFHMPRADLREL